MFCNCTLSGTKSCITCPSNPNNQTSEYFFPNTWSKVTSVEQPLILAQVTTKYFCSHCDKEVEQGSFYCNHCGARFEYNAAFIDKSIKI